MDPILKEYGYMAIKRGGIFLYRPEDALKVIQGCRRFNIKLTGLDGFILTYTTIQPSIAKSTDYTSEYYDEFDLNEYRELYGTEKNSDNGMHWTEAENYVLDNLDSGYHFEIGYERPK